MSEDIFARVAEWAICSLFFAEWANCSLEWAKSEQIAHSSEQIAQSEQIAHYWFYNAAEGNI